MGTSDPKQPSGNREVSNEETDFGSRTDHSVTPPHGDPERSQIVHSETGEADLSGDEEEGPGPAEGHTDNKAGG